MTEEIASEMEKKGFKAMEVYGPYDLLVEGTIKDDPQVNRNLFNEIVNPIVQRGVKCTTYLTAVESEEKEIEEHRRLIYLLIDVDPRKVISIQTELLKIEEVKKADIVYGPFDVIARLAVRDTEHLRYIIREIEDMPSVISTCTLFPFKGF
jgi:DNA-binding Lrp family transcriptional regulator